MDTRIKPALDLLAEAGLFLPPIEIGCTTEDIAQVEAQFGRPLSASYKDFLTLMGRDPGEFLRGEDCYFPVILELRMPAQQMGERMERTLQDIPKGLIRANAR